jgi:hypothetical protein
MGEPGTIPCHRYRCLCRAEAVALADRKTAGLDPPRQHGDEPGRRGSRPAKHAERSTIRHGTLAKAYGLSTGARVDLPTTRPPRNETKQRNLTFSFAFSSPTSVKKPVARLHNLPLIC